MAGPVDEMNQTVSSGDATADKLKDPNGDHLHGDTCECHGKKLPEVDSLMIQKRVSDNLIRLLDRHPFYGSFLINTDIYEVNQIPTAATNGINIYYNKYFFDKLSNEEIAGVLLHEVLHIIYSHCDPKRKGSRTKCLWNQAQDYVINLEIDAMSGSVIKLPAKCLLDKKYDGMYPEQVYDLLEKKKDKKKKDKGKKDKKDDQQPGGGGGQPQQSKGPGEKQEGDGGEGSEGDGQEPSSGGGHGPGCDCFDDHMDMEGGAEGQRTVEDRILGAAAQARKAGNLPANIGQIIETIKESKVPWNRTLLRFAGQTLVKTDYSYSQFNRRFLAQDLYLPSMHNYGLGTIALFIDSSGSIYSDPEILNQFGAELKKLSNLVKEIHVLSVDTEVHTYNVIQNMAGIDKAVKVTGGGGTDFRPPFEELKKRRMRPELAIYLTDGEGAFPEKAPDYPVIWVMTPDSHVKAPWGITIKMKRQ